MKRVVITIIAFSCLSMLSCATGGNTREDASQDTGRPAAGTVSWSPLTGDRTTST